MAVDEHETVPALPPTRPMLAAPEPSTSSRGRLLMVSGMVMFLLAATLVVVAQSSLRRAQSSIVIQVQR